MKQESFKKENRLAGAKRFDRVFREGRRRSGRYVSVYWLSGQSTPGKLGLIVAKRITRTGVLRNRVKRAAREAFRRAGLGNIGIDVVVRLRAPIEPDCWDALRSELARCLGELR
ncbi:MAG: ribonuclease P protein component [Salinibacterium sp.]|nr:ribonuclease P protein component [Salinibacterium sp.]